MIVRAFGYDGLEGLLSTDSEVIVRTHSDTPDVLPTPGPTMEDITRTTILVYPLDPNQIDTGPVMYAYISQTKELYYLVTFSSFYADFMPS